MGKGIETGTAFLTGVRSKITDPEQLAAFEKLVANQTFVTEIGNGVEGQSEIDRRLQQLRDQQQVLDARAAEVEARDAQLGGYKDQLDGWFATNREALEEAKQLKGRGHQPAKATEQSAGFTEEKLGETLQQERAAFLGFQRDQNAITRNHFAAFGEILDLEPLLRHPQIASLGLTGTYELVHKERLAAHTAAVAKKAEDAIRLDERTKTQAQMAQMPYPSPTGSGSGSPLDALTAAKEPVVDAAVVHYNRLQLERAGAPGQ